MNNFERLELQRFQEEEEQAEREAFVAINGFFLKMKRITITTDNIKFLYSYQLTFAVFLL